MRVKVFGEGDEILYGTYNEDVTVYAFWESDGSFLSQKFAEEMPNDTTIDEAEKRGATLQRIENNPKIVLDNGEVVYGCQVWWSKIEND